MMTDGERKSRFNREKQSASLLNRASLGVPPEDRDQAVKEWTSATRATLDIAYAQEKLSASQIDDSATNGGPVDEGPNKPPAAIVESLRSTGVNLYELLLLNPMIINGNADSDTPDRRILIEFLTISRVAELVRYVASSVTTVGDDHQLKLNLDEARVFADFLTAWLENSAGDFDLIVIHASSLRVPVVRSTSADQAFKRWANQLRDLAVNLQRELAIAPAVDHGNDTVAKLDELSRAAESASGEVGDKSLGIHYSELASNERNRAKFWAAASFSAIISTVGLAALTLGRWVDPGSGWAVQLVHLALTLPIAAGAAYASKISSRHRAQAWWADTTAAQLRTFNAFSSPLDDNRRSRLRETFGAKIFVHSDRDSENHSDDSAAVASAAREALRFIQPNKKENDT